MKAYICDRCQKQAEPDKYDLTPDGWISVSPRDDHKTYHYCGAACNLSAAVERASAEVSKATAQLAGPTSETEPTIEDVLAQRETPAGAM